MPKPRAWLQVQADRPLLRALLAAFAPAGPAPLEGGGHEESAEQVGCDPCQIRFRSTCSSTASRNATSSSGGRVRVTMLGTAYLNQKQARQEQAACTHGVKHHTPVIILIASLFR